MFNLAEELFAPGRKHTEDERQRLALTREDQGDGDPGEGPIDLTSGRVTIRVPGPAATNDRGAQGAPASGSRLQEAETVGEGSRLAAAGDAQLGEDVGDVDARRLR
ncbi:DUF6191 domain-containing protein [Streptomyces sp. NPDC056527]|uniref:DUF6191 domain-containing protein n=1 Tax=Streptomyces sp. NPDC056527 TaxID=3345853 RepID=UPI0036768DDC